MEELDYCTFKTRFPHPILYAHFTKSAFLIQVKTRCFIKTLSSEYETQPPLSAILPVFFQISILQKSCQKFLQNLPYCFLPEHRSVLLFISFIYSSAHRLPCGFAFFCRSGLSLDINGQPGLLVCFRIFHLLRISGFSCAGYLCPCLLTSGLLNPDFLSPDLPATGFLGFSFGTAS